QRARTASHRRAERMESDLRGRPPSYTPRVKTQRRGGSRRWHRGGPVDAHPRHAHFGGGVPRRSPPGFTVVSSPWSRRASRPTGPIAGGVAGAGDGRGGGSSPERSAIATHAITAAITAASVTSRAFSSERIASIPSDAVPGHNARAHGANRRLHVSALR